MSKDFRGAPPTLTETPSIIDARALADILGALYFEENGDARHIAIDGKKMRPNKDGEGNAEHVLSAFCGGCAQCSRTRPRAARVWKFPMR
jgi:hypothetical protein